MSVDQDEAVVRQGLAAGRAALPNADWSEDFAALDRLRDEARAGEQYAEALRLFDACVQAIEGYGYDGALDRLSDEEWARLRPRLVSAMRIASEALARREARA